MRKLIFGMNATLDGYITATGDDIGWSGPPNDELFQWWLDQERANEISLYGRKLWQTMSSYSEPSSPDRIFRFQLRAIWKRAVAVARTPGRGH
ncbi:hypothetical protein ABGB18_48400 [Nonomuraea sp. B12E4]|uniref:hypothetical protein n=1 Tax=Nonomuraea sp. B12E4 TaxID=3153564 RepID=UPI00325CBFA5